MSDQQPKQTPILDLLRDIPADARMVYEVTPTHHQSIPVGVLAKKAADEIERLTAERDEVRAERDALRAACKTTLMLRQLGGMMPGTKAVIDVAIHHAEEALAQIEQEKANGSR